jgi:hypothetical protein
VLVAVEFDPESSLLTLCDGPAGDIMRETAKGLLILKCLQAIFLSRGLEIIW